MGFCIVTGKSEKLTNNIPPEKLIFPKQKKSAFEFSRFQIAEEMGKKWVHFASLAIWKFKNPIVFTHPFSHLASS